MIDRSRGDELQRQIIHALLLEWTLEVEVHRGRSYVDFVTSCPGPLGIETRQRFRLFLEVADERDVTALRDQSESRGETPVAILLRGSNSAATGVVTLGPDQLNELADQSGVLTKPSSEDWSIDTSAIGDLAENQDTRLTLVNGLLWLRPLARNRVPPALRRTGRPAHELFERCFFTVMSSTFGARGTSWGTEKRGEVRPDGLLELPNAALTIYDCKASFDGYAPTYRDILGFADYVNHPTGWAPPASGQPRFLVVSSAFRMSGTGSFRKRRDQLARKAPGVELATVRARDLIRFAVLLERSNVSMEGRLSVNGDQLLQAGEVQWPDFELQLVALRASGYVVSA